jgi:signal transduction histidine kinase
MSEEQQKILFTKFILLRGEAKAGMPSDDYSTGLGLYIVKKLTDAMHGEISCQSAPNQGSTFTLTLPRTNPMLSQR